MKRVLTGIQPTAGQIHIGNYFGAIRPMVELAEQKEYEMYMFVANMHALTEFHEGDSVRQNTYNLIKIYLACGLDPEQVTMYTQSDIAGNAQLFWTLSCVTHVGFMKRMHAYKAAVDEGKGDEISMGTFNYPILMAADIILYDADFVPVGKDQKQHVEYARDIAQKFNHQFGETFKLPEALIKKSVATVPGIDGRKMSKSYNNYIGMIDDEKTIKKKVMRIPTDAIPIEDPKDPDTCNVFAIYKLFLDEAGEKALRKRYTEGGLSYKDVKTELAEQITNYLKPIQERYAAIDDADVKKILAAGKVKAEQIARKKIEEVYQKVGFTL